MKWTKEKPTKSGWYLIKFIKKSNRITQIHKTTAELFCWEWQYFFEEDDENWLLTSDEIYYCHIPEPEEAE